MVEINVRPMEQADVRLACQLMQDNRPASPPPGWPGSNLELQRTAFLHPRACREGALVAEAEGRMCGALVFHNYVEEETASICLMCVDGGSRGMGVGRALITKWEENARALGLTRLLAPETPEEDKEFIDFAKAFGFREGGKVTSWARGDEPMDVPEDEHVVPLVNVPLSEVTAAFRDCFPNLRRTQDDLHALITQSQWGPWASLAYVEEGRVLAFLFTTDRDGQPYMQHVGTRPEVRRRGLALQLLKHALHVLREGGAPAVECEIFEGNVAAAKLAASFGMEPKCQRVVLVKDLA